MVVGLVLERLVDFTKQKSKYYDKSDCFNQMPELGPYKIYSLVLVTFCEISMIQFLQYKPCAHISGGINYIYLYTNYYYYWSYA